MLLLPLIFLSLLVAIWSGWIRIGWTLPINDTVGYHGAMMVNSFLASLIFLERAVTFKKGWWLLLPAVNAFSLIAFILHQPRVAEWLITIGSAGFTAMCLYFVYRYRELYYYVFMAGAVCLFIGNITLLKTQSYPGAVTWWIGFLLLTIVAERLELSRFLALTGTKRNLLLVCLAAVLVSLFLPFQMYGNWLFAGSIAATALWLLRFDMAKHSIRMNGQHRYSGLLLMTGFVWLLVMAILLIFQQYIPYAYDAILHTFFIGFVFSMIFSHAPIVLPAVTRMLVKIYRPFLYVWFVLLQLTLLLRVIGDCLNDAWLRKVGGIANGFVILGFFVSVVGVFIAELRKSRMQLRKT